MTFCNFVKLHVEWHFDCQCYRNNEWGICEWFAGYRITETSFISNVIKIGMCDIWIDSNIESIQGHWTHAGQKQSHSDAIAIRQKKLHKNIRTVRVLSLICSKAQSLV